jgi:hypothetical protein
MNLDILQIDPAILKEIRDEVERMPLAERQKLGAVIQQLGAGLCGPEDVLSTVMRQVAALHENDKHLNSYSKLMGTIGVSLSLGIAIGVLYSDRLRQKVN